MPETDDDGNIILTPVEMKSILRALWDGATTLDDEEFKIFAKTTARAGEIVGMA